jgi:hypothetical protein
MRKRRADGRRPAATSETFILIGLITFDGSFTITPVRESCETYSMRRTVILCVAVVAFAVGVHLPKLQQVGPDGFGAECDSVAKSLALGNGWSDSYGPESGPTAHVAPVYPLILQFVYRAFGTFETVEGRRAQQYCSLGVAILAMLLLPAVAQKLGLPRTAGWGAAFLAAWLPMHRWHHVTGFEQGIGSLLVLALLWDFASLAEDGWRSRRCVFRFGVLVGVTALSYPSLLLAPVLFTLCELARRSGERRQVLRGSLVAAAVSIAIVAPWAIRNFVVLGGFVPFRSNFGLELAIGNRTGANGYTYAPGFYDLHPIRNAAERKRLVQIGEIAYMAEQQRRGVSWIAEHPAEFVRLSFRRAYLFWFVQNDKWYHLSPRWMLGSRVYGLMGVCLALELMLLLWFRPAVGLSFLCVTFGLGAPYFVTHVEPRYTVPFVNIAALATCSIAWVAVQGIRSRRFQSQPVVTFAPIAKAH